MNRALLAVPALAAAVLLVSACSSSESSTTGAPTSSSPTTQASSAPASNVDIYTLPGSGVFPEGITADDETFYVTATGDGSVFRGTLGTPEVQIFLPGGADGRTGAAGIDVSDGDSDDNDADDNDADDQNRLVIAGGATGKVWVYDSVSGSLVGTFTNGLGADATFLNDVVIADNGDVFVTDSRSPTLFRIPAEQVRDGAKDGPLDAFVDFTGSPFAYGEGFNANGIVEADDDVLVLGQSSTGNLYRVDTRSKETTQVDLGGETLVNADGLELDDDTLYVVRNRDGLISRVDLSDDGRSGRVVGDITDGSFAYPTTVAATEGRLLVVNSQFDKRGGDPVEPFTVSSIRE